MSEIIFLAILALIVIGPKELPQLARTLGRFINELKRSSNILTDELKQQVRMDQFDLNSTMSRPQEVKNHEEELRRQQELHQQQAAHDDDPQQMELGEQPQNAPTENPNNTDSNEKKNS